MKRISVSEGTTENLIVGCADNLGSSSTEIALLYYKENIGSLPVLLEALYFNMLPS